MQGLRPIVQQQDENSVLFHRGALPGGKAPLGAEGGFAKGTPLAGFPSARKALGNISNRPLDGDNGGAFPSKTPGLGGARRALGDITNNASVAKPLQQQQRAPLGEKLALATAPAAAAACKAAPRERATELADEPAERSAGASWQELEATRAARAGNEIQAALDAVLPTYPTFFPHWGAGLAVAAASLTRDSLASPPPSPPASPKSPGLLSSPGRMSEASLPEVHLSEDLLALLLFTD